MKFWSHFIFQKLEKQKLEWIYKNLNIVFVLTACVSLFLTKVVRQNFKNLHIQAYHKILLWDCNFKS